ncbi:MAG: SdiA-regulated domain-containing protein [Phaeodactylibacter sp.]|nr:SdiA-regulated domain-containing protein [Phaeodactylibacter sp.]MCB9265593.1 SdiA-regulated domain-containing protein [Lewinellaceae bacterium]
MLLKTHFPLALILMVFIQACTLAVEEKGKYANSGGNGTGGTSMKNEEASGTVLRDSTKYYFDYDLKNAIQEVSLPGELREVSGLSLSHDGAYLLAVNDEQGKVFFLDSNRGKVIREISFGEPGDYEGIEMVGHHIYIVRSDGVIFEVDYSGQADRKAKPHYTALTVDHDVEGLGYDKANHRLLVACKGKAGEGKAFEGKRAIYSFSLDSMQLSREPAFLLSGEMAVAKEAFREAWWSDVLAGPFVPSAISVHPVTGHIYILSSKGKGRAILVMAPSGELLCIRELDKDPFNQPEGICFAPDGTMYISTEAKGKRGKGRIFKFEML